MGSFSEGFWDLFLFVVVLGSIAGLALFVVQQSVGKGQGHTTETTGHVWDEDLQELNNPLPRWWFNLFLITIIFAGIYLVLYPGLGSFPGVLNWSQASQYEQEIAEANARYYPLFERFAGTEIPALVDNQEAQEAG